jgi:hypothetical protein
LILAPVEPGTGTYDFSIGINSITVLEVTRQTVEIRATLHLEKDSEELALIDSGAGGNFIDKETATRLQLSRLELRRTIVVRNVDGTKNHKGLITHRTILEMTIANKRQWISLLITGLGKQKIILGLPWLAKQNPDIDWQRETLQWRPTPLIIVNDAKHIVENNDDNEGGDFTNFTISLAETYEEDQETDQNTSETLEILKVKISDHFSQIYGEQDKKKVDPKDSVSKTYHRYLKLFSKKASERYPNPRPYDHEIRLKDNFKPIRQSPYSLNPEQTKLAQTFIKENLDKGYITAFKIRNGFTPVLCRKERRNESTLPRLPKTKRRNRQGCFPTSEHPRSTTRPTRSTILHQTRYTMGIQQYPNKERRPMEGRIFNTFWTIRTNRHVLSDCATPRNFPTNDEPHLLGRNK